MTFSLPQKTRILWLLRIFFIVASFCAIIVKFCKIKLKYFMPTLVLIIIGSVFVFIYTYVYLKSYKITFNNSVIVISKGVIIKTTVIVPYLGLAYVKCFATPIMTWLGLKFIVLKVTRGWFVLPEIENKYAETFLKAINNDKNDY